MGKRGACFFIAMCAVIGGAVYGQDFGFGDDDAGGGTGGGGKAPSVSIGGEVSGSFIGYINDFSRKNDTKPQFGDVFLGKLNFYASTPVAEGAINLRLNSSTSPISIDEGYARAYLGNFDITAGLRKLTWGKADSLGPLDVINPLDYSRVSTEMADNVSLVGVKIARPLVHASFRFGRFSKIEAVFVPWFEPHDIPREGRWAPTQMRMLEDIPEEIDIPIPGAIPIPVIKEIEPETRALDYAQAGLRFTTTIGSADIGAQYYYGRLPQPSVKITGKYNITPTYGPDTMSGDPKVEFLYNPYHQIGIDYAQVLLGLNVRAELAANITYDVKGNDGAVYNPSIAWSFGFDRDIVFGISLNLQVNESIRLMHDKLGGDINDIITDFEGGNFGLASLYAIDRADIEGGNEPTSTRLTAALSRKFLRDELELRAGIVWGIEDRDAVIMSAITWTKGSIRLGLAGGFFAGNKDGQLGQFKDNHFLKLSMAYTF